MSCRLWPHPRRRSRCLSLGPQPPPPPRGPEDVRLSRSRPRWGPGREKTSGSELRRNGEDGGVEGTLQRDRFTAGRSQSEVFCASSFHKKKTLFREWFEVIRLSIQTQQIKTVKLSDVTFGLSPASAVKALFITYLMARPVMVP